MLSLDAASDALVGRLLDGTSGAWTSAHAERVLEEERVWRSLERRAEDLQSSEHAGATTARKLVAAAERIASDPPGLVGPSSDPRNSLLREARRRLWSGSIKDARQVLDAIDVVSGWLGDFHADAVVHALRLHADVTDGETSEDVRPAAQAVLGLADDALDRDDVALSAEFTTVALGLLFHPELHVAVERSPLVDDPAGFLEGWRASKVHALIARATVVDDHGQTSGSSGLMRAAVLPGTYSHHAGPLLDLIGTAPGIESSVVALDQQHFRGMAPHPAVVEDRLLAALGRQSGENLDVRDEHLDAVLRADVVIADWADKGTVWASTRVPESSRMVVRIHSVDVLSSSAQLVDWSRVDDVVFVSEHIRDLFADVVGSRAARARFHVVTNIVRREDFPDEQLPEAQFTIGLVGWGQRVKDPILAIEILERLLEKDDRWRLRLIGRDYADRATASRRQYERELRAAALRSPVVDHIDYVGFTRDVARELRHVGFILSTSLRESCPVGVLEGIAAGAYPVVREWPEFARLHGARRLFPEGTVFADADEAVERILELKDPEARAAAVRDVHEAMAANFSDESTAEVLLRIVAGREQK